MKTLKSCTLISTLVVVLAGSLIFSGCSETAKPTDFGGQSLFAAKPAAGPTCVSPPSSLVSWWPLDETSGTTAADIIGTDPGTHVNGPTPAVGKVAGALSFDGTNDFVQIPDSPSFNFTDWTVDAWIQTTGAGSLYRRIINQQVGTTLNNPSTSFWIMALEDNKLNVCSQSSDGTLDTPSGGTSAAPGCITFNGQLLNDGQFHHVAATREAGVAVTLYIDGVPVMTKAITSTAGFAISDDVYIGKASTVFAPNLHNFNGIIA